MLRLLTDEDLDGRITDGLVAANEPTFDLVRVQDVGLMSTPDDIVLEWAFKENRILLTQDGTTMPPTAFARFRQGLPVPGILVNRRPLSIGGAIRDILLMAQCSEQQEWQDRGITYIPLR